MSVARYSGISPDFELRAVRPYPSEAQGGRHVDIGWKAAGTLTRAAAENLQWLFQVADRDSMLAQVRCAFEAGGRLARHHFDRMNGALGCRAHSVKSDQRAR